MPNVPDRLETIQKEKRAFYPMEPFHFKTRFCSSLVKIMQKPELTAAEPFSGFSALRGEVFSFQVAYYTEQRVEDLNVKVLSRLKNIRVRSVESVPVRFLAANLDDDVITKEPGLIPDILAELPERFFAVPPKLWRALWITVRIPRNCKAGMYDIAFEFNLDQRETVRTRPFQLEVLNAALPEQKLIRTEWFHTDALATYYNVPVFSEEYWYLVETFMKNAADHGINMILTPVFTPPLDTEVGQERPTVQLVGVKKTKDGYEFDFDKLARWIALAESAGIRFFEISHLFTQWGAGFTPKIMADVNGTEKRIFGWDVKSDSAKYKAFLKAFLPELTVFLKEAGIADRVYFHTSDEPSPDGIATYSAAANLLRSCTADFKHIDALSEFEFYEQGLVDIPIPVISKVENFIQKGLKHPWTYYCCCPETGTSNRFLYSTSARTRILGTLFHRFGIEGFLHWGFNFYFSRLSRYPIDPYQTTDAGYAFPAGDPFLVYPGNDCEPVDSIRHELLFDGLQDQRALELLEEKIGEKAVRAMLDKASGTAMTMTNYPRGEKAMLKLRREINRKLKQ